ncbi:MAG: hypothetical protein WC449_05330 [Candidatus Paceibacterota bacterium]
MPEQKMQISNSKVKDVVIDVVFDTPETPEEFKAQFNMDVMLAADQEVRRRIAAMVRGMIGAGKSEEDILAAVAKWKAGTRGSGFGAVKPDFDALETELDAMKKPVRDQAITALRAAKIPLPLKYRTAE